MKQSFLLFFVLFLSNISLAQTFTEPVLETQKILSEKVYFDFGKYEIRVDADSTLQTVLEFCKDKKALQIKITAHTDAIGSNENNQILSMNRAGAVKTYLIENGLQIDSIETAVYGEESPVAENNSDNGRQKNRRATIDIFKTKKMIWLEGDVIDKENNKAIDAEVIVRTKELQDTTRTDSAGHFRSKVPLGAVAGIDVYAKGYFFESQMLKALPGKMKPLELKLAPVRVGEKVDLKNLYYVGNQAVLLPKSKPELPKILKFMEINYCAKIEIAGHVNVPNQPNVRESSWEYLLSKRRAKLVYDYLLAHGIEEKRISYKGYGNWEMRFPKARTEHHQAMNRRVEIRILETGMDKISEKNTDEK